MAQTVADLPPEMITEVLRRLNTPGNAERARAVAKTWLAANKPLAAARTSQLNNDFVQAVQDGLRWAQTGRRRSVVVYGTTPMDEHTVTSVQSAVELAESMPGLLAVALKVSTLKQTVFPRLSQGVARGDVQIPCFFRRADVAQDGIRRLWNVWEFDNWSPGLRLAGRNARDTARNAILRLQDIGLYKGKNVQLTIRAPNREVYWFRVKRNRRGGLTDEIRHHVDDFWDRAEGELPTGQILQVRVDLGHPQTLYPLAANTKLSQGSYHYLLPVDAAPSGRVNVGALSDLGVYEWFDSLPVVWPPTTPPAAAPPLGQPAAPAAPPVSYFNSATRTHRRMNGTAVNLSMNGVLGHDAIQQQINARARKGKKRSRE